MPTVIKSRSIVTPDEVFEPGTVVIGNGGTISAAGTAFPIPADAEIVDLPDATLVPGFIDVHVHGGGGFSLATRDPNEIRNYARWVVSHGVTGFLATVFASDVEDALEFVRTAGYASDWRPEGGAAMHGIHLEGPFVNKTRRGALPESWARPPDPKELASLSKASDGSIKVITLAPELKDAREIQRNALKEWIVVAVGHTDATYEQAQQAFETGATHLTHAFNGMRPFHHRDPGPVLAAIEAPDATLEVIADGVHLHPATVRTIVRAAGPNRIVLVSDAVPPAGLGLGIFQIGHDDARLVGERVLLPDGTIAGGSQTMDQIVRNVIEWQAADLPSAVRMASTVPARVLSLDNRKGRIAPGYDADLVALDDDLDVIATWVQGRLVYQRDL
jgi:N-acetylglucosamine-6-phosphate deacetylase